MKASTKRTLSRAIICLIPMLLCLKYYDQLPALMPSHWGLDGQVDGYMNKNLMVFGMPLFLMSMTLFVGFMLEHDPKKANMSPALKEIALCTCPLLSLLLMPIALFTATGYDVPVTSLVFLFVGLLFAFIGNYLPKSKQSYTMGIKLPWTLNSEENWNATHRLAGKVWVIGGAVMVLLSILTWGQMGSWATVIITAVIVALVAIPSIYSFWFHCKNKP